MIEGRFSRLKAARIGDSFISGGCYRSYVRGRGGGNHFQFPNRRNFKPLKVGFISLIFTLICSN